MSDKPFMVHSNRWLDDAWNYEEDDYPWPYEAPPPDVTSGRVLAWWLAMALFAVGAMLAVVAAALFSRIIGL